MSFENVIRTESFVTKMTFEITSSLMEDRDVSFEIARLIESFVALRTFFSLRFTFYVCFTLLKSFRLFFTITNVLGFVEDMAIIHGSFSSLFYPVLFICI